MLKLPFISKVDVYEVLRFCKKRDGAGMFSEVIKPQKLSRQEKQAKHTREQRETRVRDRRGVMSIANGNEILWI